jgi:hypothetical protein
MDDFFARESEVLESERIALDDAIAAFEKEARNHKNNFAGAGRLNKLLAKGLTKLSKREEEECLTLLKELKASHAPLDAKFEQLKKRFGTYADKLRVSIKSIRERTGFEEREQDKLRVRQVDQISGLLAYGLANACVSEASPWRFARSLVADFRASEDLAERRRIFNELAAVLPACKTVPATEGIESSAILSQFEALSGEELSSFYRSHRDEIIKAQDKQGETKD